QPLGETETPLTALTRADIDKPAAARHHVASGRQGYAGRRTQFPSRPPSRRSAMSRGLHRVLAGLLLVLSGCSTPPPQRTSPSDQPVLFGDLGSYHQTITTSAPTAQAYFDQGLRLVYAFNHDEAQRAFREAAGLDPACAMCYWGIAIAYGSNYNSP